MRNNETVDKQRVFNSEIKPIIKKVKKLCNENQIPCFMTFGTLIDNKKISLDTWSLIPELYFYNTKDKVFSDLIKIVSQDFDVVLRKDITKTNNISNFLNEVIEEGNNNISRKEN